MVIAVLVAGGGYLAERHTTPPSLSGSAHIARCTEGPASGGLTLTFYVPGRTVSCASVAVAYGRRGEYWTEQTPAEATPLCSMSDGSELIEVRGEGSSTCAALTGEGWHPTDGPLELEEEAKALERQQKESEEEAERAKTTEAEEAHRKEEAQAAERRQQAEEAHQHREEAAAEE